MNDITPSPEPILSHGHVQQALIQLLPNDYFGAITILGILIGIGYYIVTKDSWLLVTFLGILTGTTVEKSRALSKK